MKNKDKKIIYVGKAKVLRTRIQSYFRKTYDIKTQHLVNEIRDFEYIITESEIEALLLEINLIKKNKPKYNIVFKDDKNYPFIKITNERYPRLLITRKILKDKAFYFGPYPNSNAANEIKNLLNQIFPLRKCEILPKRPCLYFHIKQCLAPCIFNVSKERYMLMIEKIKKILGGGFENIKKELEFKMKEAASNMDFEKAIEYRKKIQAINKVMTPQKITTSKFIDRDVFGYAFSKRYLCIQVFFIRNGKMTERKAWNFPFFSNKIEDNFLTFLGQFYNKKTKLVTKEILVPHDLNFDPKFLKALFQNKISQPKKGEKKALVEMANKNAQILLNEKIASTNIKKNENNNIVENLGILLGISPPFRIESFDNSHISGTFCVAVMVVFINGLPVKKEYRKYKLKNSNGQNDLDSTKEVIFRRYSRTIKEKLKFPDLIIVDGGKSQVEVAKNILKNKLGLNIPILGLSKNKNHKTHQIFSGNTGKIQSIKKSSPEFLFLARIQDETHRFAVNFHRELRNNNSFVSNMDNISGLGYKRKTLLLKNFRSLKEIKNASVEDLKSCGLPINVAKNVYESLNQK